MHELGIDIGTTNIKLSYYVNRQLIKEQSQPVITYYEDRGKVYQKPSDILEAIIRGVRLLELVDLDLTQIALSAPMHSIMAVCDSLEEERLYIWSDNQAAEWVKEFKKTDIAQLFYEKSGTPIHPMSPFAKIAWFKQSWPNFTEVSQWLGIKEWLMYQLVGHNVVDYSIASATGLFNIHRLEWDKDILSFCGITTDQLARPVDTDAVFEILPEMAQRMRLTPGLSITIGASDGCLASLASFIATGETTTVTLGTSGAVRKLSDEMILDSQGRTFCYYLNRNYWVVGGATNNGGQVLDWAGKMFFEDVTAFYSQIDQILTQTTIGANNVLFYPYLNGERAPLWDANATAKFDGLKVTHTRYDMLRAVIEGIIFNLKLIADLIRVNDEPIILSGGFFNNKNLIQLTANIFGNDCVASKYNEPSFGALCLNKGITVAEVELVGEYYSCEPYFTALYTPYYQSFSKGL